MKKILSILSLITLIILGINNIQAQDKSIVLDAEYTGDFLYNVGGLKNGGGYLGYAKMGMDADLWNGASLYLGGGTTHGIVPTETLIGDYQVADNIEAGNYAFMEYLSLQQSFGRFSIKIGLQDMNENFASLDAAGEYVNSSFGIHPALSSNMSVAIFPITGLGAEIHFDINDNWHLQAAAYDGKIPSFEDNPYNLNWNINKEEGALFIGEAQYITENGAYELGAFYHTAEKKYGIYANVEQEIWNAGSRSLKPFAQISYANGETICDNYLHLAAGLNLESVFFKDNNDSMGLAFTSAFLSGKKTETAIELFYKYQITDNFMIKPDIQYIINPGGMDFTVDNALVGMLRFAVVI
ncbi:MAG: carbohydrate porin [Bacteroidales bacterium]|nr:carbohydrate porin [Bacteroidales bacterium]